MKKNKTILLCVFSALLISDLLLIKSYSFLMPGKEVPPVSLARLSSDQSLSVDSYKNIWENNIFHTGSIPLQLGKSPVVLSDPVKSSLPFTLKGTIIHANPRRSVATIDSGRESLSYQQGDVIEKQAEIKEISRARVTFFNQNNNRLEYITIPEEAQSLEIAYEREKKPEAKDENALVKRTGDNEFQVRRSDVNDYLQRLPEILKQARVVPHYSEKGGEIEGFRFANIDKGSVFEDLGFEEGDIIKEVDGESVTNPEKALELFDRLKGGSGFKMLVQKDGRDVYYDYSVREDAPIR